MFHIGQQVKCVKVGAWQFVPDDGIEDIGGSFPVADGIYTVAGGHIREDGDTYLFLNEFEGKAFLATHFRPVKQTNIDCFTSLLNPSPTKQLERA